MPEDQVSPIQGIPAQRQNGLDEPSLGAAQLPSGRRLAIDQMRSRGLLASAMTADDRDHLPQNKPRCLAIGGQGVIR